MGAVLARAANAERLAEYLADLGDLARIEDRVADGLWLVDEARTDAELALVVANYRDTYIPDAVRTHLAHLRDYAIADPAGITAAQTIHVLKDVIRALHFLNSRLRDGDL